MVIILTELIKTYNKILMIKLIVKELNINGLAINIIFKINN